MSQEFPQAPDGNRQESNLSGAVLGDFLLLRLLGRGGMAEVYLADQPGSYTHLRAHETPM